MNNYSSCCVKIIVALSAACPPAGAPFFIEQWAEKGVQKRTVIGGLALTMSSLLLARGKQYPALLVSVCVGPDIDTL